MKQSSKEILNELLVDVFNHILDIEQECLKKNGVSLSMTEVHVVEAISLVEPKTMTLIARKLRITLGTLTTSVDRLVKKGYVIRLYDESDRRKVLLKLTELGEAVLLQHKKFHEEMLDSLFVDTNIEEDERLIKSLQNLKSYFKFKY